MLPAGNHTWATGCLGYRTAVAGEGGSVVDGGGGRARMALHGCHGTLAVKHHNLLCMAV